MTERSDKDKIKSFNCNIFLSNKLDDLKKGETQLPLNIERSRNVGRKGGLKYP